MNPNAHPRMIVGTEAEHATLVPEQLQEAVVFIAPSFIAFWDLKARVWRYVRASSSAGGGTPFDTFKFSGGILGAPGDVFGYLSDSLHSSPGNLLGAGQAQLDQGIVDVPTSFNIPTGSLVFASRKNFSGTYPLSGVELIAYKSLPNQITINSVASNGSIDSNDNSAVYWSVFSPSTAAFSSKNPIGYPALRAGRINGFSVHVIDNELAADTVVNVCLNGVPVASGVVIPATTIGDYASLSPIDVSAGDLIDVRLACKDGTAEGGAGAINITTVLAVVPA